MMDPIHFTLDEGVLKALLKTTGWSHLGPDDVEMFIYHELTTLGYPVDDRYAAYVKHKQSALTIYEAYYGERQPTKDEVRQRIYDQIMKKIKDLRKEADTLDKCLRGKY